MRGRQRRSARASTASARALHARADRFSAVQPQDRLQVGRALRSSWRYAICSIALGHRISHPHAVPEVNGRRDDRCGATPASALGAAQAAGPPETSAAARSELPGPPARSVRSCKSPRARSSTRRRPSAAPPTRSASRGTACPQRDLVCRLQRAPSRSATARCHPLTISDGFSRYLLRCAGPRERPLSGALQQRLRGRPSASLACPHAIRTDNGAALLDARARWPLATAGLVDPARDPTRADPAGSAGSERTP